MNQVDYKSMNEAQLLEEIERLSIELEETAQTLNAIRKGEVDALVVSGLEGERIFTLEGSEHIYRIIVETMSEAALIVDVNGSIIFANQRFHDLVNLGPDADAHRDLATFIAPRQREELRTLIAGAQSGRTHKRMIFQKLGGGEVPVLLSTSGLENESVKNICIVITDLSDLEASHSQLRTMAFQLSQAEEVERKRLADVLHDHIQQLLVGIRLHLDIVTSSDAATRDHTSLQKMDDLLDETIEAARTLTHELSPRVLHTDGLVAAIYWLAGLIREKHGLVVHVDAAPIPDAFTDGMKIILFRSIQELLFNVVKHSGVKHARIVIQQPAPDAIVIEVSDNGRGFDPEQLSKNRKGYGLLSISERLRLVDVSFEMWSQHGEGSRFRLVVPVTPMETAEPHSRAKRLKSVRRPSSRRPDQRTSIRVLLADDHAIMREGFARLIQDQKGMEVVGMATNGQQAIAMAESLLPDVVVMDVSMPVMDGIQATRRITAAHPGIRVIGLTFHEGGPHRQAMFDAGAESCLNKADRSELLIKAITNPPTH